jgi:hypothetical protein
MTRVELAKTVTEKDVDFCAWNLHWSLEWVQKACGLRPRVVAWIDDTAGVKIHVLQAKSEPIMLLLYGTEINLVLKDLRAAFAGQIIEISDNGSSEDISTVFLDMS